MDRKKQIKRKLKIYGTFIFLGTITILLFKINYKAYTRKTLNIGDQLPQIFINYNHQFCEIISDSSIAKVIIIYEKDCAYCEMTLKDTDKNIKNIDNALFFFLSHNANPDSTKNQYKNLSENSNSIIKNISTSTVIDSLCVFAFPTIYIVDKHGIIREIIKGAAKFSIIDSAINRCGVLGQNKNENVPFSAEDGKLN